MAAAAAQQDFVGYNEWAAQRLGVTIATDFVYELQGDERGVFIAEDVAPHTQVFAAPLHALLTVRALHDHVDSDANGGADGAHPLAQLAFFRGCDADCEDDQLALALLYETHVARGASRWSEHLARLPQRYSNALYFGARALRRLRGSNLFFIAQQMQRKVADDYAALRAAALEPLFAALLAAGSGCELTRAQLDAAFSLENYRWALSTVWSRFVSLRVAKTDGSLSGSESAATAELAASPADFFGMTHVKAMVPVFDMLNHDPEAEMAHFLDLDAQSFRLVSHQHWAAGAQMFINYGALSNHKLLALYGFVLEHNPFDALDVWFPMDETTTSRFEEKAALLAANGFEHATTPFELTQDEVNELLLIAVRIQEIECGSSEELQALAAKALDGEVLSFDNEHATLTRLIYTLQKMLEEFGDDDDGDDGELQLLEASAGDSEDERVSKLHERMAVVVRRSDKTILAETIEMLKWKLLEILPTP